MIHIVSSASPPVKRKNLAYKYGYSTEVKTDRPVWLPFPNYISNQEIGKAQKGKKKSKRKKKRKKK